MTETQVPEITDLLEHARTKGMWAGALTRVALPDLHGLRPAAAPASAPAPPAPPAAGSAAAGWSAAAHLETAAHIEAATGGTPAVGAPTGPEVVGLSRPQTPALLKIIDEVIVNALDHAVATGRIKGARAGYARVSRIDVSYERGVVVVRNDGPGFPIVLHAQGTEMRRRLGEPRPVYSPEVSFSVPLAGTNIHKNIDNVNGGTNGLGLKLTGVHSEYVQLETVDAHTKQRYVQRFEDRLRRIQPPTITSHTGAPFTRIEFKPAYHALDYNPTYLSDLEEVEQWMRLRVYQAAAYLPNVAMTFNGQPVVLAGVEGLARLVAPAESQFVSAEVKAAKDDAPWCHYPWRITAVVLPPGQKQGRRITSQNMAIVNGVMSNKGSHVTWLRDQIKEHVTALASKKKIADENATAALAGVKLVMAAAIPTADWGGQRKDELQLKADVLKHFTVPPAFLKRVAEAVCLRMMGTRATHKPKKAISFGNDYVESGSSKSRSPAIRRDGRLIACEGSSAMTFARTGMGPAARRKAGAAGARPPSFDWCGIISLGGVPMNAMNESSEYTAADGTKQIVMHDKLLNNDKLSKLIEALGLNPALRYETDEEVATLRYGGLILMTDQDADGVGKIAPLALVFVNRFWPALLRRGFVSRYVSPLVRMYPLRGSGLPREFDDEADADEWQAAHPDWADTYHPRRYYKGLGAHDPVHEVPRMFAPDKFARSVFVYKVCPRTQELFHVYYGNEPDLRKRALRLPVRPLTADERADMHAQQMPMTVQFERDSHGYKLEAISRQAACIVDGLLPVRRKVLAGANRRLTGKKDIKVFQLGGYVADNLHYHHGDASLNGTITGMAQSHMGTRFYPMLVPTGNAGSRHNDVVAAPRYLGVRRSPLAGAMFPKDDVWTLPHVFEDGERAEPRWYVPVLPLAALETGGGPTEAYSPKTYGRRLEDVTRVVLAWIDGDQDLRAVSEAISSQLVGDVQVPAAALSAAAGRFPLAVETRGFKGTVRPRPAGKARALIPHYFGKYTWDRATSTVTITETPPSMMTDTLMNTLNGPKMAEYIVQPAANESSDVDILVRVRFLPGKDIQVTDEYGDEYTDAFEQFFHLYESTESRLVYYGQNGGVIIFPDYLTVVLYWVNLRVDQYVRRVRRERALAQLKQLRAREILRFIPQAHAHDLAKTRDDDHATAELRAAGYRAFGTAIDRPGYCTAEELLAENLDPAAGGYEYLLSIPQRGLTARAVVHVQKQIDEYQKELDVCDRLLAEQPTPCGSLWRAEICKLLETVRDGINTRWTFHNVPDAEDDS